MPDGSPAVDAAIDDIIRKCMYLKDQMRDAEIPTAQPGEPEPASGTPPVGIGVIADENVDGIGISLEKMGYSVKRVRIMRMDGSSMADDFNIIKYAKENGLALITRDKESGRACENNDIPCVWIKDDTILRHMVVPELERMSREREGAGALG